MHKTVKMSKNGRYEKVSYRRRSVGERERVKTIKKKGYFESAEELLSLINNLSFFAISFIKLSPICDFNGVYGLFQRWNHL